MNEKDVPSYPMVTRIKKLRLIRNPPTSLVPEKLALGSIAAYDVHFETGSIKTVKVIKDVPRFLIEAFNRFHELNGERTEGIFRKEGNATRMKGFLPLFYGCTQLSSHLQIHDVCSLIKKFFREIKTPIFHYREAKLIQLAEEYQSNPILVNILLTKIEALPSSHIGTLIYIMQHLQELAMHAERHQMNIRNLATVFAPSLFRGKSDTGLQPIKAAMRKMKSHENLLEAEQRTNELQVLIVKLLIENAHRIKSSEDVYSAVRKPSIKKRLISKPGEVPGVRKVSILNRSLSTAAISNFDKRNGKDQLPNVTSKRRSGSVAKIINDIGTYFMKPFANVIAEPYVPPPVQRVHVNRMPKPSLPFSYQTPIKRQAQPCLEPSTTASSEDFWNALGDCSPPTTPFSSAFSKKQRSPQFSKSLKDEDKKRKDFAIECSPPTTPFGTAFSKKHRSPQFSKGFKDGEDQEDSFVDYRISSSPFLSSLSKKQRSPQFFKNLKVDNGRSQADMNISPLRFDIDQSDDNEFDDTRKSHILSSRSIEQCVGLSNGLSGRQSVALLRESGIVERRRELFQKLTLNSPSTRSKTKLLRRL